MTNKVRTSNKADILPLYEELSRLISNAKMLCLFAERKVTPELMLDLVSHAARSIEERDSTEWRKDSTCWKLLFDANQKSASGGFTELELKRLDKLVVYWMEDFVTLPYPLKRRLRLFFNAIFNLKRAKPFVFNAFKPPPACNDVTFMLSS